MAADQTQDARAALELGDADGAQRIAVVGRRPVLIGRDRGCDVVVRDSHISRHHALVWIQKGMLHVRDLGSALGTRVGTRTVQPGECLAVQRDEVVLLADRLPLCWQPTAPDAAEPWTTPSPIERRGDAWTVGGDRPPEQSAEAGGDPLSDTHTIYGMDTDWDDVDDHPGHSLTVSCEQGAPARAVFEDPHGQTLKIRGEVRVVLLYLLARRRALYDAGRAESPWVDDYDIGVGLWGSRASTLPASRLNTLVTRVREQLAALEFPRDLVQKRAGRTRLGPAVGSVALQGQTTHRPPGAL